LVQSTETLLRSFPMRGKGGRGFRSIVQLFSDAHRFGI
jgi:hypothetical protein